MPIESARPSTVAVLVVRVWSEESTDPPSVRIRLTGRSNVGSPLEETRLLDTTAAAVGWIEEWLHRSDPVRLLS